MRRSLIALGAIALIAVAACSGSAATTAPTSAPVTAAPVTAAPATADPTAAPASAAASPAAGGPAVSIKNFSFNPATVTAKAGDTISWTNGDDAAHTVTFDDASVTSSGNITNGATFTTTIAKAGTYAYHCKIHPSMKGSVTVS